MKCVVNWWKSLFRVTTIEFQFNHIYIYKPSHKLIIMSPHTKAMCRKTIHNKEKYDFRSSHTIVVNSILNLNINSYTIYCSCVRRSKIIYSLVVNIWLILAYNCRKSCKRPIFEIHGSNPINLSCIPCMHIYLHPCIV